MPTISLTKIRPTIAACMLLAAGCATVGSDPEADIRTALDAFHAAQQAGDIDLLMDKYSESFTNAQGATKDMVRPFLQTMLSQGLFNGVTPMLDNLSITVEGDAAVATPVEYTTPIGKAGWTYEFAREDGGVWRITNAEQLY